MRTLAVINQKGGCGKTTTAINLAASLAGQGQRTLLVDMDPQGHCALGLAIPEDHVEHSVADALRGGSREFDLNDGLWQINRRLDLLPATVELAAVERELADAPDRDRRLHRLLRNAPGYRYCIIDCPPNIGILTFNALRAAGEVIIPVEAGYFALHGAIKQATTLSVMADRAGHHVELYALATMYAGAERLSRQILGRLRQQFGRQCLRTPIHHSPRLQEAASVGQPITEYDPSCQGARDYQRLARHLMERETTTARPAPTRPAPARAIAPSTATHPATTHAPSPEQAPEEPQAPEPEPATRVSNPSPVTEIHWARSIATPVPPKHNGHRAEPTNTDPPRTSPAATGDNTEPASAEPASASTSPAGTAPSTRNPAPKQAPAAQNPEPNERARELVERAKRLAERTGHLQQRLAADPDVARFQARQQRDDQPLSEPAARRSLQQKLERFYGVRVTDQGALFVQPDGHARNVCIAGDFNGWRPESTPMQHDTRLGVWQRCLHLPPGSYRYRLVIDGQWTVDPHNQHTETNPYGELNNVLEIGH